MSRTADRIALDACLRALGDTEALAVGAVRDGRLILASPALSRLLSLETEERPALSQFVAAADRERLARALDSPGEIALGLRLVRADGRLLEAQLAGCRVLLEDGPATAFALQESGRERDLRSLSYAALFDGRTGLPNRALLMDRLEQAVLGAARGAQCAAVMAISLEGGGATGSSDELWREAGARLRACLRESDTLAYLGEGRFAVVLPRLSARERAGSPAARVVAAFAAPPVGTAPLRCRVALAAYPDDARSPEELLERAFAALPVEPGIAYAVARPAAGKPLPGQVIWSERFAVGIEVIDGQHRHLVDLVNRLGDELRGARDSDALIEGLRELLRYTEHHFATEERLMDEVGAEAQRHRAEHRRLIDGLARFSLSLDPGGVAEGSRFLQDWLFRHIEEVDRPFAALLRTRGLK